jgi:alpha-galactosidase
VNPFRGEVITTLPIDPATALVHEHGWQSWSPTATYRVTDAPIRPADDGVHLMNARPGTTLPRDGFHGEGLLAVQPAAGEPVHVFATPDARDRSTSIRASLSTDGRHLVIAADGFVEHRIDDGPHGDAMDGTLARWADTYAGAHDVPPIRPSPTAWCSWYHYFEGVTERDVLENLDAMDEHDLPVEVVQLDDGWEAEIGDWLALSDRFASLESLVARIRAAGRRAGIWVAPFLVGARSRLASEHRDWLVGAPDADEPANAGHNWDQRLFGLDLTNPGAAAYVTTVFEALRGLGFDYFKVDFIYAGALPGRRHEPDVPPLAAYRSGVQRIRNAIGDAYLLGCGAPILPSVGLFDAMRISPDTAPHWEPVNGDLSTPGARGAVITGRDRAFQHGRFWVNDPDCLIVRPAVERREDWAAHVERFGGLRASSDRIRDLDAWGLAATRRILGTPPPDRFVPS